MFVSSYRVKIIHVKLIDQSLRYCDYRLQNGLYWVRM